MNDISKRVDGFYISKPTSDQLNTILAVADLIGMNYYPTDMDTIPNFLYGLDDNLFVDKKIPTYGKKVTYDEFIARLRGEKWIPPTPKCLCGSELKVVKFSGYYDEFNMWICSDENCTILDDLKPECECKGAYS